MFFKSNTYRKLVQLDQFHFEPGAVLTKASDAKITKRGRRRRRRRRYLHRDCLHRRKVSVCCSTPLPPYPRLRLVKSSLGHVPLLNTFCYVAVGKRTYKNNRCTQENDRIVIGVGVQGGGESNCERIEGFSERKKMC